MLAVLVAALLAITGVECAKASPSDGGGDLVFVSDWRGEPNGGLNIYRMDANGHGPVEKLTDLPGDNVMPAWSSDGTEIAFVHSDLLGIPTVYRMGADGEGETPLTSDLLFNTDPTWFPGGQRIIFSRSEDIYAMILDLGGDPTGKLTRLTRNASAERQPSVSPNGRKIAFTSDRDGDFDVYVMKARPESRTNRPVKLTQNTTFDLAPDWSPDGTMIAFSSGDDGAREVYVMKAAPQNDDTNRPINLTGNAANDSDPAWSPDGTMIAFTSDRSGNDEIWRINADGTDPTNLTNSPSSQDLQPAWEPLP